MDLDSQPITFTSSVQREGTDVEVTIKATVSWSSGMDEKGHEAGYLVEDLEALQNGLPISLYSGEREAFKQEALARYLD